MSDSEVIETGPELVELSDGSNVLLEELKLRQFLRLLRIVTEGTPPGALANGLETLSADDGNFGANLLVMVMLGIPNAEDAVINFLASMVRPVGLVGGPGGKPRSKMTKQELERDEAAYADLEEKLQNPDLEDTLILIEAIFKRSASDFGALGKRLASMFEVAKKTGILNV